jgi:signal transduction histidine kinase
MVEADGLDKLTDAILENLPEFAHSAACSVFLVQWNDQIRAYRLVLHATTWTDLKSFVQRLAYEPGQGLTGWVWQNARPLRLRNLQDENELAQYPNLRWARLSDDSPVHREFLGVPIFNSRHQVIGVIRMSHCKRLGGYTSQDEFAVQAAAREIGRAIEYQWLSRTVKLFELSFNLELKLLKVCSLHELVPLVLQAMAEAVPQREARYFYHRVRETGKFWEVVSSTGDLPLVPGRPTIYSTDNGLAGQAIRTGRTALMTDVSGKRQPWDYVDITQATRSAIATPVLAGDQCLGVLAIVAASEYAFLSHSESRNEEGAEPSLRMGLDDVWALELIAQVTAAALVRLRARDDGIKERVRAFRAFASSARHALGNWVYKFEAAVNRERALAEVCMQPLGHLRRLIGGLQEYILATNVQASPVELGLLLREVRNCWAGKDVDVPSEESNLLVHADRERTLAVLNELIQNALDHGKPPVKLWVTRDERLQGSDNSYCCVHILDCGPGIKSENRHRIYDWGWTTKPDHTGCGLFSARYVAEQQNGRLDDLVDPSVGTQAGDTGRLSRGAHFRLALQVLQGE